MPRLVSAIIPTFNRAPLLARALQSVAAQDYRPIEAIVVDDGSTDDTPGLVAETQGRWSEPGLSLIVHRQSNGRAPLARNNAMKMANGSIYAFLDSDDLWMPRFVSTMVRLLDQFPSAGLAFCKIVGIDAEDRPVSERPTRLPPEPQMGLLRRPFELILRYMPTQTSGVAVRREIIQSMGDFDLSLPVVEDWDLWYRIAKAADFAYTLEGLACNRLHAGNLPKFDLTCLGSNLRMNLAHLPDVHDEETRDMLTARIRRQMLLLQEELLRHGTDSGLEKLLDHELAPRTARYRLGAGLRRMPRGVGRVYSRAVKWVGSRQRALRGAATIS